MTTFDIVVCSTIGLSVVLSLFKGFVKEIFSLVSYLGGYLMAAKYQGAFSQVLMQSVPGKGIAKLLAFAAIYILTAIIISLMGKIVRGMLPGIQLSVLDRLMGGVVGFARGVVIVVALTFSLHFFPDVSKGLTKDSQTAPYLKEVLAFVNRNPEALNFRKKLGNFNFEGAKEKFDELKEKLPNLEKDSKSGKNPLDEYSSEDLKKLNDILKSFEKK